MKVLWLDNSPDVQNAMNIALDELKSSKILLDAGQYRSSIASSYFAIFSATKSLLFLKNRYVKTHKWLINAFIEEYYNTGEFSDESYKCLTRSHTLRREADYDFSKKI